MSKHLDAFDELVVGLQTLREPVDEARQLVVLLSSLPAEYELISSIVEDAQDITLNDVKEKLLKEYERLEKKKTMERAFKVVNAGQFKGGRAHGRKGTIQGKTVAVSRAKKRTIGCRWVFTKKRDENGRVIHYMARLVAKEFKQKFGVSCFEMYSPVVNMNSIRVVLAVCVGNGYIMEQLTDTAFLNSGLKDLVYMEGPPFGIENDANHQAASACNNTIHQVFMKNGFKRCGADQCVYVKYSRNGYVYVCLYVDDMIIAVKTSDEIREVKNDERAWCCKIHFGYGDHDKEVGTIMIKQTRYIDDVAERFGQRDTKRVDNP
ncbi:Integrase, catalytic core protein [Phytophthora megakarya]|uniref:Integrase, catalytic core protein n=1 Tax=Phytophthora megakarya TaxID=4795 RepID=A0A225WNC4_9STRA|nr:Integrase, catalytic core protein [Phytophthora megakarya]